MKAFCYYLLYTSIGIIFSALMLVSCDKKMESEETLTFEEAPIQGNNTITLVSSDIFLEGSNVVPDGKSNVKNANFSEIRDILPNDFVLISHVAVNLNEDTSLEHIVLYSINDEERVNISIASVDPISKKINFIWKEETSSTNLDSHSKIEIAGITGEFQNDIVVIGNNKNKKTIDVYTMQNKSDLKSYKNVFTAEGDDVDLLELNQQKYSEFQEFQEFQNVSTSVFQIVILNTRDDGYFVREFFKWDAATKNVEKFSEEVFNQEDISQEKLSKLGRATEDDVKEFLNGAWYKVSNNGIIDETAPTTDIDQLNKIGMVFSDNPFGMLFYDNISQSGEAYWYEWKSSFRLYPRYAGGITLRINIKSNILPSISDWIFLDIVSGESFYLNVRGTLPNIFSGEYKKIRNNKDLSNFTQKELGVYSNSLRQYARDISGVYLNEAQNNFYLFEYPKINIVTQNSSQAGLYTMFQLENLSVLEIRIEEEQSEFYKIDQCDRNTSTNLCESLTLIPLYLFSDGVFLNRSRDILELKLDKKGLE